MRSVFSAAARRGEPARVCAASSMSSSSPARGSGEKTCAGCRNRWPTTTASSPGGSDANEPVSARVAGCRLGRDFACDRSAPLVDQAPVDEHLVRLDARELSRLQGGDLLGSDHIRRVRERRNLPVAGRTGVGADTVDVGVDHHVDRFRREAGGREATEQAVDLRAGLRCRAVGFGEHEPRIDHDPRARRVDGERARPDAQVEGVGDERRRQPRRPGTEGRGRRLVLRHHELEALVGDTRDRRVADPPPDHPRNLPVTRPGARPRYGARRAAGGAPRAGSHQLGSWRMPMR